MLFFDRFFLHMLTYFLYVYLHQRERSPEKGKIDVVKLRIKKPLTAGIRFYRLLESISTRR